MAPDEHPILFAYDGSPGARLAIERAATLVTGRSALVLSVWSSPIGMAVHGMAAEERAYEEAQREAAGVRAAEGCQLARDAGFVASPVTARADGTWQAILEVADEHDASVVVVGARGLGGLQAVLLGSVSDGVVRHARRPVLVVHDERR